MNILQTHMAWKPNEWLRFSLRNLTSLLSPMSKLTSQCDSQKRIFSKAISYSQSCVLNTVRSGGLWDMADVPALVLIWMVCGVLQMNDCVDGVTVEHSSDLSITVHSKKSSHSWTFTLFCKVWEISIQDTCYGQTLMICFHEEMTLIDIHMWNQFVHSKKKAYYKIAHYIHITNMLVVLQQ